MAKAPRSQTEGQPADPKFKPLIDEARYATSGLLYRDKDGAVSITPGKAPLYPKDLADAAVDAGLFTASATAGRWGGVYITDKGRFAQFPDPAPADQTAEDPEKAPA